MATDHTPLHEPKAKPARRRPGATVLAAGLGAVIAVFAVLNVGSVKVNWIVASTSTPLVIVIVLSLLVGFLCGLVARGRRRR